VSSQHNASICLRVHQGLHQGASVSLSSFESGLLLGASGAVDVQLRDAPGSAQLAIGPEGWVWQEQGFSHLVASGVVWRWGAVVLGLAHADDAWPLDLPTPAFERVEQPAEASSTETATSALSESGEPDLSSDSSVLPDAEKTPLLKARTSDAAVSRPWTTPTRAVVGLAVLIVLILLAMVVGVSLFGPRTDQTPLTTPQTPVMPVNMKEVEQLLFKMELGDSVQAKLRPNGRLLVRGVAPDEEQIEALVSGIRKLTQQASFMVITQDEFAARVSTLQNNLPTGVRALPMEKGQLILEGVNHQVDWSSALMLTENELPEVVRVKQQVPDSEQVAHSAESGVEETPAPVVRDAAFPAIPRIASVMGGAGPYLMLAQGQKWLPGGKMGGLTLLAIEDQSLVFEDAQGRQWRRPR
jgi:hypothetical protein